MQIGVIVSALVDEGQTLLGLSARVHPKYHGKSFLPKMVQYMCKKTLIFVICIALWVQHYRYVSVCYVTLELWMYDRVINAHRPVVRAHMHVVMCARASRRV